jgi:hypothetical protein
MFWAWPPEKSYSEYSPDYDWVHPFKFSKIENQEFVKKLIRENISQRLARK